MKDVCIGAVAGVGITVVTLTVIDKVHYCDNRNRKKTKKHKKR